MTASLHATVSGKVQGVYFRAWVFDQATSLGLVGWVRNLREGQVEVLAQGDAASLAEFKQRLTQGSPLSRVESMDSEMIEYEKAYATFEIRG